MSEIEKLFLEAYRAAMGNQSVDWRGELSREDWLQLFDLAAKHKALPLVFEAVYRSEAAGRAPAGLMQLLKQQMLQEVLVQIRKTAEFTQLYREMNRQGIYPLVLKGIVLRSLYPNPDCRPSGDEDLLLDPSEFEAAHRIMLSCGFEPLQPVVQPIHQVAYVKRGSPTSIELHQSFFDEASGIYGDMNRYFYPTEKHSMVWESEGMRFHTLGISEHLLFLIFHAFKHFINCGVGVRQIADICLYANAHGGEIDWEWIFACAGEMHAEKFLQSLLQIGCNYLTLEPERACLPPGWKRFAVDETAMLEDILSAGVYGKVGNSRAQGSRIVQIDVEDERKGRFFRTAILRRIFPSARVLRGRYPYLATQPYRLPLAWVNRIWTFRKQVKQDREGSVSAYLQYADRKRELLRQYGIIEK